MISALHHGEKRLVFCDSRKQVEELGAALRARDVTVFLSHASLSADERARSDQAFAEARDCVIVSASTLELGIDVGDLDRVIQIDSPGTVASFLQRIGRTGRRAGTSRNCLFLATRTESLLQAAGLLTLWALGWVEPVTPPPSPRHPAATRTHPAGAPYRRPALAGPVERPRALRPVGRPAPEASGRRRLPEQRRRHALHRPRGREALRPPPLHGTHRFLHRAARGHRPRRAHRDRHHGPRRAH
ncbi:helicase-related protein [Streptomyces pakalii]|uniref:helicase-related protein n=1 Tax=Streptomyces pakalii TaxID=3036494 RepID=UPI0037DA1DCF